MGRAAVALEVGEVTRSGPAASRPGPTLARAPERLPDESSLHEHSLELLRPERPARTAPCPPAAAVPRGRDEVSSPWTAHRSVATSCHRRVAPVTSTWSSTSGAPAGTEAWSEAVQPGPRPTPRTGRPARGPRLASTRATAAVRTSSGIGTRRPLPTTGACPVPACAPSPGSPAAGCRSADRRPAASGRTPRRPANESEVPAGVGQPAGTSRSPGPTGAGPRWSSHPVKPNLRTLGKGAPSLRYWMPSLVA